MKLHEDNDVFIELIEITAETIGIPQVYVEKDYWVTKALKYLSESSYIEDVVFKGGTSLSKAYKLINRFSEDIDLSVFPSDKSDGARKKLIKDIEGTVTQGLDYLKFDERESKGSRFRKTVHQYPRKVDGVDFGQASPELPMKINLETIITFRTMQTLGSLGHYLNHVNLEHLNMPYGYFRHEIDNKRVFMLLSPLENI